MYIFLDNGIGFGSCYLEQLLLHTSKSQKIGSILSETGKELVHAQFQNQALF